VLPDRTPAALVAGAGPAAARPDDEVLARAFAGVIGPLGERLRRLGDPVGYLAPSPIPEFALLELSPEDRAHLLSLLAGADAELRFRAAVALVGVDLRPEELAELGRLFEAELAGLRDPAGTRMVLALALALDTHGDRTGVSRVAESLRNGTGSEVRDFRSGAALLVALTARPENAPLLRDLLDTDPDRMVRKHSAIGLGTLGGEENREALARALIGETNVEVRAWAALASGRAATAGETPDAALLRSLAEDPAGEVRGAAAYALSRAGGEELPAILISSFRHEEHSMARLGAVAGLAPRAGEELAAAFLADEGVPFLRTAAEADASALVRIYSVAALTLLPEAAGRGETFRAVSSSDKNPFLRLAAADALIRTEGAQAAPFLEERLLSETTDWVKAQLEAKLAAVRPPTDR
jgi:HEAT repeat protein